MSNLESNKYNINKIKLFPSVIIVFALTCAKVGPPVPLSESYEALGEKVTPSVLTYGPVAENNDSIGVQKYDEASWIKLQFKGEIDTSSGGIGVLDAGGNKIDFIKEWDVFKDKTYLVLKPAERLEYNTIYILQISGSKVRKAEGNHTDFNGNGVSGEVIADDFVFPFVTFKSDNSSGDWSGMKEDRFPPFIVPTTDFLVENKISNYVWTDANIALHIYDYTWRSADTSVVVRSVDSASIGVDDFKIVEENTGEEIVIKGISYIDDKKNPVFGRVIIEPLRNFKPQRWYVLKVFGGISDEEGNELGENNSVVFEKKFKTFNCNSDSSECIKDTISPEVVKWKNFGIAFEVFFSEILDPESINENSVYVPKLEGELSIRNYCGQTIVRFTTSRRVNLSGYTVFLTGEIKDFSGNKIKEVSHYFERKID
jgi:hypothetical protein